MADPFLIAQTDSPEGARDVAKLVEARAAHHAITLFWPEVCLLLSFIESLQASLRETFERSVRRKAKIIELESELAAAKRETDSLREALQMLKAAKGYPAQYDPFQSNKMWHEAWTAAERALGSKP